MVPPQTPSPVAQDAVRSAPGEALPVDAAGAFERCDWDPVLALVQELAEGFEKPGRGQVAGGECSLPSGACLVAEPAPERLSSRHLSSVPVSPR